jgi:transposase
MQRNVVIGEVLQADFGFRPREADGSYDPDEPRGFGMAVPVPLREDFDAVRLRGVQRRRRTGHRSTTVRRTEAAKIAGVGLQIARDWVVRFNARGPDGLLNGRPPGQPSRLNDAQRQAIVRMIESGPIPAIHGVVRWRLIDLAQWIFEEFRVTVAKPSRRSAANCVPWAIVGCLPALAITRRPKGQSKILKKLPDASGRDRARESTATR